MSGTKTMMGLICMGWGILMGAGTPLAWSLDGDRALTLIREQCNFGPRIPGTEPHRQTREWIKKQLTEAGWTVEEQEFRTTLPLTGAQVTAWNIYGLPAADGPSSPALLLSAHWDTRPRADQDPTNIEAKMDGANDGAAGVAMLLELARELKKQPAGKQVALAFWDAEDSGVSPQQSSWCLGSQHAAKHPPAWIKKVRLGINLDMVAHKGLQLKPEGYSVRAAPREVAALWQLGTTLAPEIFIDAEPHPPVMDDHYPWIQVGLPYIDLIGFPYAHWHTTQDKPTQCDPAVMNAVGQVLIYFITEEAWKKK